MSIAIILAALAVCIIAQAFTPRALAWVDDENDGDFIDEDGWDRTPGQEPREVGLP